MLCLALFCSSARGAAQLCMHSAFWSRSINLEYLGMAYNVRAAPHNIPLPHTHMPSLLPSLSLMHCSALIKMEHAWQAASRAEEVWHGRC